jgi:hypothetical protein
MFKKMLFVWITMQCTFLCASSAYETENEIHLTHDAHRRLFHVSSEDRTLGTIVSSSYGVLDFYDAGKKLICVNVKDELFDLNGNNIGISWVKSDHESVRWWENRDLCGSTKIVISRGEELFHIELEGSGFVFRDADTQDLLAIALWDDQLVEKGYLYNTYTRDWRIITMDAQRLQEKDISNVYLIWALMKHIQKGLLSPEDRPYDKYFPDDPPKAWYCMFGVCDNPNWPLPELED